MNTYQPWARCVFCLSFVFFVIGKCTADDLLNQAPAGNAGLFVGVETFDKAGEVGSLKFSVESAIEMAHLFVIEMRLIPAENCFLCLSNMPAEKSKHEGMLNRLKEQVVKNTQGHAELAIRGATKLDIVTNLRLAVSKGESHGRNVLVNYFTSHGFEEAGIPYLVPSDGNSDPFFRASSALDFKQVQGFIATQSKAGHKLVFCDACREVKEYGMKSLDHRILGRPFDRKSYEAFSKPTPGIYKCLSCDSGQKSYEDPEFQHGVFTYYLMNAIRDEHPDQDQDGTLEVTLGNVVRRAKADVEAWSIRTSKKERTEYNQTPIVSVEDEASRIKFEKLPLTRYVAVWSSLNWLETVTKHPSFKTENQELWKEALSILDNFDQSNAYHKRVAEIVAEMMMVNNRDYFEYQMQRLMSQKPIYIGQVSRLMKQQQTEGVSPKEISGSAQNASEASDEIASLIEWMQSFINNDKAEINTERMYCYTDTIAVLKKLDATHPVDIEILEAAKYFKQEYSNADNILLEELSYQYKNYKPTLQHIKLLARARFENSVNDLVVYSQMRDALNSYEAVITDKAQFTAAQQLLFFTDGWIDEETETGHDLYLTQLNRALQRCSESTDSMELKVRLATLRLLFVSGGYARGTIDVTKEQCEQLEREMKHYPNQEELLSLIVLQQIQMDVYKIPLEVQREYILPHAAQFEEWLHRFPNTTKSSLVAYNLALQTELENRLVAAVPLFQRVIDRYPESEYAAYSKTRIKEIGEKLPPVETAKASAKTATGATN